MGATSEKLNLTLVPHHPIKPSSHSCLHWNVQTQRADSLVHQHLSDNQMSFLRCVCGVAMGFWSMGAEKGDTSEYVKSLKNLF